MNSLTTLYRHQQVGVDKLKRPRVGALFMDMGTGKTRAAIELALLRQNRISKVVWFCPVSLKDTIRHEIRKHVSGTPVCVFDDKIKSNNIPGADWYIIGTESMSSSNRVVLTAAKLIDSSTFVIVDESEQIKGHRSRRTNRITALSEKAKYRLILTGTPMSQGIVDLYAQMRFLSPVILGYASFYSFARNHLEYSEKYPGLIVRTHNEEQLAAKMKPYVYQVTKEDCLDLPDKLYESRYFSMTEMQGAAYWQAKQEILLELLDDEISSYTIFRLFTALQQITCGYWNRKNEQGQFELLEFDHARLDTLSSVIAGIPASEKVIIWCKHRYSIDAVSSRLKRDFGGDSVALFYGDLTESKRLAELEKFRGERRFFVASAQCAGRGLTLNESHYTIFYEDEFKYANRLQAEDRNHRIGQEKPVTYISIICQNSIDERIAESQAKKGDVIDQFKQEIEKVKGEKGKLKKLIHSL
jgi:SNF2 family DNA or RNA helicase